MANVNDVINGQRNNNGNASTILSTTPQLHYRTFTPHHSPHLPTCQRGVVVGWRDVWPRTRPSPIAASLVPYWSATQQHAVTVIDRAWWWAWRALVVAWATTHWWWCGGDDGDGGGDSDVVMTVTVLNGGGAVVILPLILTEHTAMVAVDAPMRLLPTFDDVVWRGDYRRWRNCGSGVKAINLAYE